MQCPKCQFENPAEMNFCGGFGPGDLCNLPWNEIVYEDNKDTEDPAKVEKHVEWYAHA